MAADGTTFPPFPPFQTIPELDPAVSLNFTDQVWINQAGLDVRCNIGDLAALAPAGVTSFNNRRGAILLNAGDIVLAEGALLNSPAFQGVPQAPTAATGTASDQIATTQFVANAIGAATPGVTSFNNRTGAVSLTGPDIVAAGGVLRNSPAFTGQPIAPTPPPGSNNNTLATTGFVTAAVAAMSPGVTSFNNRTGPIQLTLADVTGVGGAPLVTPIFTGVPQAPNPPRGSDTTQIATCEFVMDAIANSVAGVQSFNGRVGAVTLTTADITAAGGGTVSSVGLAMPTMFTVTGSPVTGSGTLTVTANAQAASTVLAAPVGAGGPPSFRSLTAADIPLLGYLPLSGGAITGNLSVGGSLTAPTPAPGDNSNNVATTQFVDAALAALPPSGGTVTSVAMTVPNIFTITGSPITTSGTLAIGNRAQNANTVFAGPVSGGQAGGTFRALVAADIPNLSGAYLPLTGGTLSGPGNLSVEGNIHADGNIIYWGANGWYQQVTAQWTFQAPNGSCYMDTNGNWLSNAGIYSAGLMQCGATLTVGGNIGIADAHSFNWGSSGRYDIVGSGTLYFYAGNGTYCYMDTASNFFAEGTIYGSSLNISGGAVIGGSAGAPDGTLELSAAAGNYREILFETSRTARWNVFVDNSPESGGNAGSNFAIAAYADNGNWISTPLTFTRSNGAANFGGNVNMQQGLAVANALSMGGQIDPAMGASGGINWGNMILEWGDAPNGAIHWGNTNGIMTSLDTSGDFNTIGGIGCSGPINSASYVRSNGGWVYSDAPAGTLHGYQITSGTIARWIVGSDGAAETGGNAGSNFVIYNYNDAGQNIGEPLFINRASGAATFSSSITSGGNIQSNGNWFFANGSASFPRGLQIQTSGVTRWSIDASGTAESGGNVGSDLQIIAYNDAGAQNGAPPVVINRATGNVVMQSGNLNLNTGMVACNGFYSGGAAHCASTLLVDGQITQGQHPSAGPNQIVVGYYQGGGWYNGETLSVNVSGASAAIQYNSGAGTVAWSVTASDRRLKANFKPASDALDYIKRLKVYDLDFNPGIKPTVDDMPTSPKEHWPFSLIADEVAEVMPHAAMSREEDDGKHWVGLHPTHLCAVLWKAVQELSAKVEALEAQGA